MGRGTLWTPNTNVNRDMIGKGDNNKIIKNDQEVYPIDTFWIGFMKGNANFSEICLKFSHFPHGLVHRSPTLDGEVRIIVKIDIRDIDCK